MIGLGAREAMDGTEGARRGGILIVVNDESRQTEAMIK